MVRYTWTGYLSVKPITGGLQKQTTTCTYIHTYGHFRVTSQPNVCMFGLWEEVRVLGANPQRHSENMQTPQIQKGLKPRNLRL